jgi:hypothetical protein
MLRMRGGRWLGSSRGRLAHGGIALLVALCAGLLSASTALAGQPSVITRFAGTASPSQPIAGPASSSPLSYPYGVAVDGSGNVYIADTGNDVVEKVTPSGNLSVFAGNGSSGTPTPGPATSSQLGAP